MKNIITLFFIFTMFISFAQGGKKIYTIIDIKTNTPIPYVNILVTSNSKLSTISNIEGEFNLKLLDSLDTVSISCVGYKSKKLTKSKLDSTTVIYLTPNIYNLAEIIITPIEARNLVKYAYAKVRNNFPEKYPILKGVYRQQIIEDSKYVLFGECNMKVKIPKFVNHQKGKKVIPKIKFDSIKLSENKMTNKGTYNILANSTFKGYPDMYFLKNTYLNDFVWKIEDTYKGEDEQPISKISFKEKSFQDTSASRDNYGYVFIDLKDSAIIKIYWKGLKDELKKEDENYFLHVYNNKMSTIFNYRKNGNKYQLDYSRVEWSYDIEYSDKEDNFHHNYLIVADFLTQSFYYGNLFNAKKADILPFKDPKNFELTNWDHFKTILPDYEH